MYTSRFLPRRRLVAATLLLAAAPLQGCLVAAVGTAVVGGYYIGKDQRSADQIAKDAAITAQVKSLLIAEPGIRALDINVDTANGHVRLAGTVANDAQRATAERLASKVAGVKSVTNELKTK
jgi:hyperosmotically inducible protein